jgi:limonene-1,2-epoxide hydrolase
MLGDDNESKYVVTQFWAAMQTNDFHAAARLLGEDYVLEWPQSGERIHGPENFAAFNEHYPAAGRWQFTVHRIIAEGDQVVTDVGVTDGQISARAITFSTVRAGRIVGQVEFWPDPFEPQEWRAQWVERA